MQEPSWALDEDVAETPPIAFIKICMLIRFKLAAQSKDVNCDP
ncbi:MAG: hypothetical protein RLZZ57_2214 [Pseudomonadota bacterium]|jgi:hypothetical protein